MRNVIFMGPLLLALSVLVGCDVSRHDTKIKRRSVD